MQHRWKERIASNPEVLAGTRISVEFLLNCLASGWSRPKLLRNTRTLHRKMCWLRWHFPPMCCGGNRMSLFLKLKN